MSKFSLEWQEIEPELLTYLVSYRWYRTGAVYASGPIPRCISATTACMHAWMVCVCGQMLFDMFRVVISSVPAGIRVVPMSAVVQLEI